MINGTRFLNSVADGLLAIVWGLQKFRPWVYGRHITVLTDHKPLIFTDSLVKRFHPDNRLTWNFGKIKNMAVITPASPAVQKVNFIVIATAEMDMGWVHPWVGLGWVGL